MNRSRRLFLRGVGGAALALPFLPSLAERPAKAGPQTTRRLIAIRNEHGGVLRSNMFPADATLTESAPYAGYSVRRGDLALSVDGATASLSPILSAPSDRLTPALVQKMNVLSGLDLPYYIAHHRGGSLGNYSDTDYAPYQGQPRITIDQLLAYSPSFYGDLSTVLMRSAVVGDSRLSWGYSNPSDPTSQVQEVTAEHSSLTLFNQLYKAPAEGPTRPPIVDSVMEDYKRLRDGNRRLSAADRARLDDHMSRLDELDRKLKITLSCNNIMKPSEDSGTLWTPTFFREPDSQAKFWQLMNDVLVAAMTCDTTRIATMRVGDTFSDYAGDWHHEVAHESHKPEIQPILSTSFQRFFQDVFLDLVTKLDAVEAAEGGTLLDSCLVFWTQESGSYTHDPISMPVVTAGGAAGWMKTGSYIDYCNNAVVCHTGQDDPAGEVTHAGLLYNQFLGTVLRSMGLEPSEYEEIPGGGYGVTFEETSEWYPGYKKYSNQVQQAAGDVLPFLKA